jgi:hypothetical protein
VRAINPKIEPAVFNALLTIAGGETIHDTLPEVDFSKLK